MKMLFLLLDMDLFEPFTHFFALLLRFFLQYSVFQANVLDSFAKEPIVFKYPLLIYRLSLVLFILLLIISQVGLLKPTLSQFLSLFSTFLFFFIHICKLYQRVFQNLCMTTKIIKIYNFEKYLTFDYTFETSN